MADNIQITAGAGTAVSTDDVSGVHYQRVKLVDGTADSDAVIPGDAANGLDVDVTRIIPGVAATNLGKAEDAAHADGDTGVMVLGVRKDTPAATAGAADDYQPPIYGPDGRMWVSGAGGNSVILTLTVTNGVYTIGDVVGGLLTFANAARINAGRAIINSVKLCGVSAIGYELWLFNADLATANQADNAVLTLAAADGLKYLGTVNIGAGNYTSNAAGTFNNATVPGVGLQFQAAAATTSIYGYLKAPATTSPGTTTIYIIVDFEYID